MFFNISQIVYSLKVADMAIQSICCNDLKHFTMGFQWSCASILFISPFLLLLFKRKEQYAFFENFIVMPINYNQLRIMESLSNNNYLYISCKIHNMMVAFTHITYKLVKDEDKMILQTTV